jgi:hypothetical protein
MWLGRFVNAQNVRRHVRLGRKLQDFSCLCGKDRIPRDFNQGEYYLTYLVDMWKGFLWFVNSNSSLWSFLVTLATIIYVILTYRLLNENVKARKLQVQPNIIVDLDVSGFFLKMIVKNIGNNSAKYVRIETQPNIENNPFSNIEFLAPGREISNVIRFLSHDEKTNDESTTYQIKINYEDPFREEYSQEYNIDISPIINATNYRNGNRDAKEIVDKLDKIVSKLDDLKGNLNKIANGTEKQADVLKDLARKFK